MLKHTDHLLYQDMDFAVAITVCDKQGVDCHLPIIGLLTSLLLPAADYLQSKGAESPPLARRQKKSDQ